MVQKQYQMDTYNHFGDFRGLKHSYIAAGDIFRGKVVYEHICA